MPEMLEDGSRAAALLRHPMRVRLMELARTPRSAADMAAVLGLPRQRVNHHVRALAQARLLRRAGRARKGNLLEQRYVASGSSYQLAPELVGDLAPDRRPAGDRFGIEFLFALANRLTRELGRAVREATSQRRRVPTFGIEGTLRFRSARERAAFADALDRAVAQVIADHASPARRPDGSPAPGRPYRLALGVYPIPPSHEDDPELLDDRPRPP